ncbi:MAG TPA: DUF1801 domain-containing protein [Devosiaceae bacterium]
MPAPANVEAYIATLPPQATEMFDELRKTLHAAAPGATETISYAIPALKQNGRILLYFSGWKEHLSIYPLPPGDADFTAAITPYIAGKGTLKFPLSRPLPHELITRIAAAHAARLAARR